MPGSVSLFKSVDAVKDQFVKDQGSEFAAIFKHGDDQLILQIITLMDKVSYRVK